MRQQVKTEGHRRPGCRHALECHVIVKPGVAHTRLSPIHAFPRVSVFTCQAQASYSTHPAEQCGRGDGVHAFLSPSSPPCGYRATAGEHPPSQQVSTHVGKGWDSVHSAASLKVLRWPGEQQLTHGGSGVQLAFRWRHTNTTKHISIASSHKNRTTNVASRCTLLMSGADVQRHNRSTFPELNDNNE
jgi:hypothetical protein